VWFTWDGQEVPYGGLVAAQRDGGAKCQSGWALTYQSTANYGFKLTFSASVERNNGTLTHVEMNVPNAAAGRWYHAVAVYDGRELRLHLDSARVVKQNACNAPSCGRVMYAQPSSKCGQMPGAPLTIGTYELSEEKGVYYNHRGAIMSVRIFDEALLAAHVDSMWGLLKNSLQATGQNNLMVLDEYWASPAAVQDRPLSHTTRYLDTSGKETLSLRGKFYASAIYQCEFVSESGPGFETAQATVSASLDELVCRVPPWEAGYRTANVAVISNGKRLWQRVCLRAVCGFHEDFITRPSNGFFWAKIGSRRLDPDLSGARARVRFVTFSRVYKYVAAGQSLQLVGDLKHAEPLGASHSHYFSLNGADYFFVCNYWDGRRTDVESSIWAFNPASSTAPVTQLQRIRTYGARQSVVVSVAGKRFLAIANYRGASVVYALRTNSPQRPIDTSDWYTLDAGGATGLEHFVTSSGGSYLVVTYMDDESLLYEVTWVDQNNVSSSQNRFQVAAFSDVSGLRMRKVAGLGRDGGYRASSFVIAGRRFLAVANIKVSVPELLFSLSLSLSLRNYIYVCMYVCMYVCIYICIPLCVFGLMYAYVRLYVCLRMCV
jgi:hypothetical protein